MLDSTWDGISPISDHIAGIRTIESRLAGMKYAIDSRLLAFTLINSLPKTPEWKTFISATVNSIDQAKLTFDDMETRIVAEASRLNPSGNGLESGLNTKGNPNGGDWWCDHHKIATHNTADCYSYQSWVKGLQEGKGMSHMACNQTWFTMYRPLSPPSPVTLGDNSSVEATGIGTITLCT